MKFKLSWETLISDQRVYKPGKASNSDNHRTPFEADYDRVVYSKPFRRLAKKTQVHPLASNDHVHNRLTHSIEVASVGRSFGSRLVKKLKESELSFQWLEEIPCILQVACLSHDIGNPPFGHAGEYAIREWCSDNKELIFGNPGDPIHRVSDAFRRDVLKFEGNAQGFRLSSRSDNSYCGYMRLTFASLGAMVKYPWGSESDSAAKGKYNYYDSEKDMFDGVFSAMGLKQNDNSYARHPLSFLTEAADDICYRIIDMEDAILMQIYSEDSIRKILEKIAKRDSSSGIPISQLRGLAIASLIDQAWDVFIKDYDVIMNGGRVEDLKSSFKADTKELLEDVDKKYKEIFAHRPKVAYELGAYKILGRILDVLSNSTKSLTEKGSFSKVGFVNKRCLELTWGEEYVTSNQHKNYEWWARQVIDYVAGLTDNYAIQISNEIDGM
jgi:dGTPase